MTMSMQARAAQVAKLEERLARAPRLYRFQLALLASLGYLVLGGALVIAFAMSLGVLALLVFTKSIWLIKLIKFIWIPLVVAGLILRALWVRIDAPPGERVTAAEAPALLEEIERLRAATAAPKLAGVLIDADLNAGAASVPRLLGLLGHRHWLVLGLPLMQSLDRAQFASVVAHEFGHFGHGDGRFGGWIYRVRATWQRLLDALERKSQGRSGWLQGFFAWYAPYFEAYSFALARHQEYRADGVAARVAGSAAAGQALLRVNLAGLRMQQDFWPAVMERHRHQADPPDGVYAELAASVGAPGPADADRLQKVLEVSTDVQDTHPAPAQRLAALGVEAELPAPPRETAAAALLGPFELELQARFERRWRDEVATAWGEQHVLAHQRRERLASLEAQDAAQLTREQRCELADLVEHERGVDAALPLHRQALEQDDGSALANFQLGRALLQRDDAEGVGLLRRAATLDPNAALAAIELIGVFHARRGDAAAFEAMREEYAQRVAALRRAQFERGRVDAGDELLPPALEPASVAHAREALRAIAAIKRIWIARKRIDPDGGVPHYVVLVQFRWLAAQTTRRLQRIADELDLPGTVVALKTGSARSYERRLKAAAGAAIEPGAG